MTVRYEACSSCFKRKTLWPHFSQKDVQYYIIFSRFLQKTGPVISLETNMNDLFFCFFSRKEPLASGLAFVRTGTEAVLPIRRSKRQAFSLGTSKPRGVEECGSGPSPSSPSPAPSHGAATYSEQGRGGQGGRGTAKVHLYTV